eukprot:m.33553 g.33553  ORF g.33553 m.33553 type:complete len:417 (-) comp5033_c0_seq1:2147-3397(-)
MTTRRRLTGGDVSDVSAHEADSLIHTPAPTATQGEDVDTSVMRPTKRQRMGPVGVPNGVFYWSTLGLLGLAAWVAYPYTVTSSYLVSCALLSMWRTYCGSHAVFQPNRAEAAATVLHHRVTTTTNTSTTPTAMGLTVHGLVHGWNRRRCLSLALSLVNCLVADVLITRCVRNVRPGLLHTFAWPSTLCQPEALDGVSNNHSDLGIGPRQSTVDCGDSGGGQYARGGYAHNVPVSLALVIWWYVSPMFLLFVHDAWFYMWHRALHASPTAYQWIHAVHHTHTAPEAWDLFYMHPVESMLVVTVPFLLTPRMVPLHWVIYEGLVIKAVLIDCYGHCGFDASPFHPFKLTQFSLLPRFPWRSVFLTAAHHDLHHKYRQGNFALYLNLWDVLLNTELTATKDSVSPRAATTSVRNHESVD